MIDEPAVSVQMTSLRMRPYDMRQLTKVTGRTFQQMVDSDEPADKLQALAFVELLHRHPGDDPAELWERAGMVYVELNAEPVDPTANGRPTMSPPSAVTGA